MTSDNSIMMRNGAASAEKVAKMRMTGDTVVDGGSEIVFNNCGSHFIFKVSRGEWDYLFNEILNRQYFIKQILLMYYFCSSKDWPLALEKLRVEWWSWVRTRFGKICLHSMSRALRVCGV